MHISLISLSCRLCPEAFVEMMETMEDCLLCVVGRGSGAISSSCKGWSRACNVPWCSLGLLEAAHLSFGCCEWCCEYTLLGFRFYLHYLSTEQDFGEKGWQLEALLSDACGCIFAIGDLYVDLLICFKVAKAPKTTKTHKDPQKLTKFHKIPESRRVRKWSSHTATTKMRPR